MPPTALVCADQYWKISPRLHFFCLLFQYFTILIFSTSKLFKNRETRTSSRKFIPRKCVFHSFIGRSGPEEKRARTHLERLRYIFIRLGRRSAGVRLRTKHQSRPHHESQISKNTLGRVVRSEAISSVVCVYGARGRVVRSLARWVGWPGGARCSAGHDTWVSQAAFRASKRAAVITTRPPARGSSNYAALVMAAAITAHSHHLSLSLVRSLVLRSRTGRKYPPREHFPAITHARLKTPLFFRVFNPRARG